jgi:Sulfotransferase family
MATFVVGTGRCGSTLLSTILGKLPGVLSLSEAFTVLGGRRLFSRPHMNGAEFSRFLSSPEPDISAFLELVPDIPEIVTEPQEFGRPIAMLAPLLLIPIPLISRAPAALHRQLLASVHALPRQCICRHLDYMFGWIRDACQSRLWIERSGSSLDYVEHLVRCWPEGRFVHLMRDGRECALSMSKHPYFRVKVARLAMRAEDMPVAECLAANIALDRFGAYWSASMLRAARELAKLPSSRLLCIRYGDLTLFPRRELVRLASFLEIDADSEWLAASEASIKASSADWRKLPPEERKVLERACIPGMRVYSAS